MSDEKKVLIKQLQLAGVGIIVCIFGLLDQQTPYIIIGVCIVIYSILRAVLIHKLMNDGKR